MHCQKHSHEPAVDMCRRCALQWCATCLVYTYGAKKPPYCIACAMVAAGVRTNGALPAASRKELKAKRKEAKRAAKETAKASTTAPAGPGAAPAAGEGASEPATEAPMADWNTPWWEAAEAEGRTPVD